VSFVIEMHHSNLKERFATLAIRPALLCGIECWMLKSQ
jgi:hypothetical protein